MLQFELSDSDPAIRLGSLIKYVNIFAIVAWWDFTCPEIMVYITFDHYAIISHTEPGDLSYLLHKEQLHIHLPSRILTGQMWEINEFIRDFVVTMNTCKEIKMENDNKEDNICRERLIARLLNQELNMEKIYKIQMEYMNFVCQQEHRCIDLLIRRARPCCDCILHQRKNE